jgi:PAS domain S-box-containing protein
MPHEDAGRTRRQAARWVPRAACAFAALVVGFEIASGLPTMAPTSAVLAVLLAVAVAMASTGHDGTGRIVAAVASLLALVSLVAGLVGFDLELGRPSAPQSALAYLLIGAAVLRGDGRGARASRVAEILGFAAAALALYALIDDLYGFERTASFARMSLGSALAIAALALGAIFVRGRDGVIAELSGPGPGGAMARALLPLVVAVPMAIGWARLAAERARFVDETTGTALMVVGTIVAFAALVIYHARTVDASQAALRETNRLLDAIIDNIPDMIFVKDARRLAFVRMNRAGEDLLGKDKRELLGKTDRDFFDAEQADFFQSMDRRTLESGSLVDISEEPIGTPRGERWLHTRKVPISDDDGRATHLLGISEDITERREAERKLRRWASLFHHAGWGVVVADAGRAVPDLMNQAWAKMHGYSVDELAGRPLEVVFAPGERASLLGHLAEAARVGKDVFESFHVRKDGSVFSVLVSLTALDDGALAMHAQDVTELKRSEEALRVAKETAEATSKELEAFSYSVSHDLRAPLRAIDGFSLALAEDYADKLDDTARDYLGRVRGAAQKMALLIDDLLELARVARHEIVLERIDVAGLGKDIVRDLHAAQPARSVEFRASGELVARADPRLLRVALTNLLENAWKFTGKKAVGKVELGRADDGHFFVRDDGVGFDMTYSNKLFGAFQRLHAAADFPGTGIGLATVQRIIHRHGGRIWAEGRLGEGATFHFTLPEIDA